MNQETTETPGGCNVAVNPDRKATALSERSSRTRVTLLITENKLDLGTALRKGMYYCDDARGMGGKARCLRSSDALIIEHTGLSRNQGKSLIDRLTCTSYATTLKVAIEEHASSEIDLESPGILPGEFAWKILNKGFLFALPHYAIIVASWRTRNGKPIFATQLEPGADRSIIWRRAVNSNAAHRPCGIYWRAEDIMEIYGFSLDDLLAGNDELAPPPFRL